MSLATRYSEYNIFARINNESWGPQVSESVLPDLEQLLLQHIPKRAHIFDLCCGTGQLAQKLVTKGYQVTGLDGSEEMLRYARKNVPGREFILADARLFKLPSTFHAVISTNYGLNHVTNLQELTSVFHNVYAALLENGLFVFDLSLDERYGGSWNNSMLGDIKDEYAWAMRRSYDPEEKVGTINLTIFQLTEKNWQRLDNTWLVKGYEKAEIQSALKSVGFTEVNLYDATCDFLQFADAGTVYFVCRKPRSLQAAQTS